ncbi:13942_t:CDS:1 [Acaulospora morrowiae]|uniref:13942_t:CDS:1 n=1 Tax=Acaulospora morrowiae TaxID=94023 RepID=A0A9N9D302_9GLOM|nr:13942_t:CDS:1 [Acaulospora morrowiae]
MAHRFDRVPESDNDSLSDSNESNDGTFYGSSDNTMPPEGISIPSPYFVRKLHEMGLKYFGHRETACAELQIRALGRPDSAPQSFYVHREYLTSQSQYFVRLFNRVEEANSVIPIEIPSPETFEPLLEYLYTGDGDKWYDTITLENYDGVYHNIRYLGLGIAAMNIWLDFYKTQVEEM